MDHTESNPFKIQEHYFERLLKVQTHYTPEGRPRVHEKMLAEVDAAIVKAQSEQNAEAEAAWAAARRYLLGKIG